MRTTTPAISVFLALFVSLVPDAAGAESALAIGPSKPAGKNMLWNGTFDGEALVPRHADLRAFVFHGHPDQGGLSVAPAALTRVAPAGSMVVNSSRGGGSKDTWVLGE